MGRPWILDYDGANCTIGAAVGIIGEKWTFLVLREAFNGVRRFDDMQRRTQAPRQDPERPGWRPAGGPGRCSRKVPYQVHGQRSRHEYRLTEAGLDLYPVLVADGAGSTATRSARRARWRCSRTVTAASASGSSSRARPGTSSRRRAR